MKVLSRYDLAQLNIRWPEKEYGILASQDNQAKTEWDFYTSIFTLWIIELSVNDRKLTKLREKESECTSIFEWNISVTTTAKAVFKLCIWTFFTQWMPVLLAVTFLLFNYFHIRCTKAIKNIKIQNFTWGGCLYLSIYK